MSGGGVRGGGDGYSGGGDDGGCGDSHDKMVVVEVVKSYLENKNNISIKISRGNKDLSLPKISLLSNKIHHFCISFKINKFFNTPKFL